MIETMPVFDCPACQHIGSATRERFGDVYVETGEIEAGWTYRCGICDREWHEFDTICDGAEREKEAE